jgi:MFS family permease
VFGLVAGAVFAYFYLVGDRGKPPARLASLQRRHLLSHYALLVGLVYALTAGMLSAAFALALRLGVGQVVALATGVGIGAGLAGALTAGLSRSAADDASPLTPRVSWRRDQGFGLAVGLLLGFGLSLGVGLGIGFAYAFGLESTHKAGQVTGLVLVFVWLLVFGLVFGLLFPRTWTASLTFAQLAMRWHTPVRLLRFLDDARERDVLRTVGPIYQFRHARLQDRLAQQATPNEPRPDVPIP